jgi:hypothetical protein
MAPGCSWISGAGRGVGWIVGVKLGVKDAVGGGLVGVGSSVSVWVGVCVAVAIAGFAVSCISVVGEVALQAASKIHVIRKETNFFILHLLCSSQLTVLL